MKVSLPTFRDEKTKDVVTYHLWQWDVAIFCHLHWNDQHLLPYVMWSLQGFLGGDLAGSLGKNATLNDVLQTLDEHYGMVITFDTLSKEVYSSSKDQGECSQIEGVPVAAGPEAPVRVSGKDPTGAHRGDEERSLLRGPEPQIPTMLAHKVMANIPPDTLICA